MTELVIVGIVLIVAVAALLDFLNARKKRNRGEEFDDGFDDGFK